MTTQLVHEPANSRYVLMADDTLLAVVDYRRAGDSISFTRTFTSPAHRGQGLAGKLVEYAVNDVEANTTAHIVPMCWYVGEWFDKHPDRKALLSPRD